MDADKRYALATNIALRRRAVGLVTYGTTQMDDKSPSWTVPDNKKPAEPYFLRVSRSTWTAMDYAMVPEAGIEPARLAAGDFESPASTNFTTRARMRTDIIYGSDRPPPFPGRF